MTVLRIIFLLCVFMISGGDLFSSEPPENRGNQSSTSFESWTPLGSSGGDYPHLSQSISRPELKFASSCFGDSSESEEEQYCYASRESQQLYGNIRPPKRRQKEPSYNPSQCCWDIIKFLDSILECICPCCCP